MIEKDKSPHLTRVTVKSRGKKRFSLVTDENLINLMKVVGKKIEGKGRGIDESKGQKLLATFLLPTNNVIEIFKESTGGEKALLFNNIDVWMSFELSDLDR